MRIFVAGGTGVVGRRAVPALLAAGHQVTALARSPETAARLRRAGARPAEVSLFDPGRLSGAVDGCEVVVNLATSIPPFSRAAMSWAWAMNDRLRSEGSRNLVNAALATDAARYVQESVAFLYQDAGRDWITEDSPVRPTRITASAVEAERQARRLLDHGMTAVSRRSGPSMAPTAAIPSRPSGWPGPVSAARRGRGTPTCPRWPPRTRPPRWSPPRRWPRRAPTTWWTTSR